MDISIQISFLFLTCFASTSNSQIFQSALAIQDVAVSSDYVYVSDSSTLHVLHNNLTHIASLTIGVSSVSKIVLNSDDTFIIVCLLDGMCKVCKIENLQETNSLLFPIASVQMPNRIALGTTSNSTIYVGSEEYSTRSGRRSILLKHFEYNSSTINKIRSATLVVTNSRFLKREFHEVFKAGKFIYYIAVDTVGDENRLTAMRVCDDVNDDHFSAITEVELDCGINTTSFNVSSISFYNAKQTNETDLLVITTSSRSGSQVCLYCLSDINRELQRIYNECVSTNTKVPLPWADHEYIHDCSRFTEVCNNNFHH